MHCIILLKLSSNLLNQSHLDTSSASQFAVLIHSCMIFMLQQNVWHFLTCSEVTLELQQYCVSLCNIT